MDAIAQHTIDHPIMDSLLAVMFVFCAIPLFCCLVTICVTLMTLLIGFVVVQGALIWMVGVFLVTFACSVMVLVAVVLLLLFVYRMGSTFLRDVIRSDAERSALPDRSLE